MEASYNEVINEEQVKTLYPQIGDAPAQLMVDYMNLARAAAKLNMLNNVALLEIEKRHRGIEDISARLHYQSADVLSLLKGLVNSIQVPADPKAFENWVKHSDEYPKVLCHDAFFDVFIASKKELTKGL